MSRLLSGLRVHVQSHQFIICPIFKFTHLNTSELQREERKAKEPRFAHPAVARDLLMHRRQLPRWPESFLSTLGPNKPPLHAPPLPPTPPDPSLFPLSLRHSQWHFDSGVETDRRVFVGPSLLPFRQRHSPVPVWRPYWTPLSRPSLVIPYTHPHTPTPPPPPLPSDKTE